MRKLVLIRCGIASVLLGGGVGGMLAAGCGGDDNGGTTNTTDGGGDATEQPPGDDSGVIIGPDGEIITPPTDGMAPKADGSDGSADGSGGCQVERGKLILVHAAMYAPSLRFCLGIVHASDAGATTITIPKVSATMGGAPAPNTVQGVPPGTGGPAADTAPISRTRRSSSSRSTRPS